MSKSNIQALHCKLDQVETVAQHPLTHQSQALLEIREMQLVESIQKVRAIYGDAPIDSVLTAAGVDAGTIDTLSDTDRQIICLQLVNVASSLKLEDPITYDAIACSLYLDKLYTNTPDTFEECVNALSDAGMLSDEFQVDARAIAAKVDTAVNHNRDKLLDIFGLKTLECGYLLRGRDGQLIERPQYLFMRVAIAIHGQDIDKVLRTYEMLSTKRMMHATPTLFNAGTRAGQLSSCYLLTMKDDSIDGIFSTLSDCAQISKHAGGIGIAASNVRSKGSLIRSTNCESGGIVPMLRVFNASARYVNQAGRRNGSIAIYLEPWHSDIEEFLELRKTYGNEEQRTRDLFTALWVPDLFMERVENGGQWSLMSPSDAPGLDNVWGDDFKVLYEKYESEGNFVRKVDARELWGKILSSQMETGLPYMLYKDACNAKTNQSNMGTIRCSNLCSEVVQYSSPDRIAVCNLCSIGLPAFLNDDGSYDFDGLHDTVMIAVDNLNKVVDRTYYPVEAARLSNMEARPIGVGVQGLADVLARKRLAFDCQEALDLNEHIFETIYHAAVLASSCSPENAYKLFAGSPASKGELQFDMWNHTPRYYSDWDEVKAKASQGMRNSLLVALMPTASTSQILGYTECFEAMTSNIYKRSTLAGEFIVINTHLYNELASRGLWTKAVRESIMINNGSVQQLDVLDDETKAVFKTAWEVKQRALLDMSAVRAPYVCQSQSMNVFMEEPSAAKLTSLHFYSWRKGLKTGLYYLRTRPRATAQKFTIDPEAEAAALSKQKSSDGPVCTMSEGCVMCSA